LAQEARGCRWVQAAMAGAVREEGAALASELRGHVVAAAESPHANHVLQLCINTLEAEDIQFIIDEVVEVGTIRVATNKYGCRIIQRLVERCPRQQVQGIVQTILDDVRGLSTRPYSNFVLQSLIMHGSCDDRQRIVSIALEGAAELCRVPHGCVVVLAAFEVEEPERQAALAKRVGQEEGLLVSMACSRQGAALVSRLFDVLPEREHCRTLAVFAAAAGTVGATDHGRETLFAMGIYIAGCASTDSVGQ